MLTEIRWEKEQELMRSVFPEFQPFRREAGFGFSGRLRGQKSGRTYRIVLEAAEASYPQIAPRVRMYPRLGIHWIGDRERRLCMEREWRPARSTFANTLLAVIRYIDEHDEEPGFTAAAEEDGETGGGAALCFWWNRRPR
jgi:hypothetical protein